MIYVKCTCVRPISERLKICFILPLFSFSAQEVTKNVGKIGSVSNATVPRFSIFATKTVFLFVMNQKRSKMEIKILPKWTSSSYSVPKVFYFCVKNAI